MDIFDTWQGLGERYKNLHIGLGNFDGLHLGHQHLISELVNKAGKEGGVPGVFTFYPHPMKVLNPEGAPPMLLNQQAKQKMIAGMGVEVLLLVPFTPEFASLDPDLFIAEVLCRELKTCSVCIGYNYTFGRGGKGNPETLIKAGRDYGFEVNVIPPVTIEGTPVSSTLIRGLLADGEVVEARKYLGYCPFLDGEVVPGEMRGRTLGFPTANIDLENDILVPANGVYAVKVRVDGDNYLGVANIGVKPTFHGEGLRRNLEVHLLDFYGDLYGKKIKVYFTGRLREEKRFSSPGELVEQIRIDISKARIQSQQ
ncbi:FMN adenylyltransferase [Desulfocucumis palustris]|uniref:Riboflavin biosynthesis protein n=1 Tax=Desulfocucumis palustris TaxID=1898651 RepID=A0A2L2X8Y4_9FIRM|nr:bifunctional riboflavin kinase/FAD synthetase [Desulfocucumis palustris]GBF32679.1 FMN adenylyltransferase [Desulfocucumis palustris]